MDKTQNRTKSAPKKRKMQNGFFGALLFGVTVVIAIRLLLSLLLALAISGNDNSTSFVALCSGISTVLSLVFGGFVSAKLDKNDCYLVSLLLGALALGLNYIFSVVFKINGGYDMMYKTVVLAVNVVLPLLGAKLAMGVNKGKRSGKKRRM